jgi:hypothetical protein
MPSETSARPSLATSSASVMNSSLNSNETTPANSLAPRVKTT